MTANQARGLAREAKNSTVLHVLARVGFAVNGVVHALIGLIALGIARGGGGTADQSGAFAQLAATPGGVFILWAIVVGMAALALWLFLSSVLVSRREPAKRLAHFAQEFGKALAYSVLAGTALIFALGGSTDSASSTSEASSNLLATPGGTVAAVAVAVLIVGIGVYFIVKGARQGFTNDIVVPAGPAGKATVALGVFGYIAKGVVLFVVGVLFAVAAFTVDPAKATGLDGALKSLATLPFGVVILSLIGVGLIAYGAYCLVRAFVARL
ncbi:DUF1206 domain-containing protein [Cryobacterium sp. CG_9.6]|uniref:DUF1206 domain-containing protein n=1 Tax=Cryobacterium sp. CG_9.6 TaxID=2760710 RepID=UPI002473BCBC|nr:DUF1206 domain-containing protein [Cryobacterium sp. CG_9.6]MDH6237862.1 multisubunit Na+/H+ antiporter MnhC subunit [Cryobacterium sp. CG_9.6]